MLCQQVQISRLTGPARNISVLFHRLYLGYHTLSQVVYGILSGVCVAILWFVLVQVPYYARKLSRVKTFANWQYNYSILRRKFSCIANQNCGLGHYTHTS